MGHLLCDFPTIPGPGDASNGINTHDFKLWSHRGKSLPEGLQHGIIERHTQYYCRPDEVLEGGRGGGNII